MNVIDVHYILILLISFAIQKIKTKMKSSNNRLATIQPFWFVRIVSVNCFSVQKVIDKNHE